MNQPTAEDIAALRADGDLTAFLLALTGRTPTPTPAESPADTDTGYRIAHPGAWPIGTAATGPTPTHGRCTCPQCEKAAVVELPRKTHGEQSDAA
ncbi:hypothetical protein [Streptomyces sp. N35]|uniref:hypothetical protein n=1 Tax=Streptomyces sp. N35 TaxID=2795730 RepID=UPI0018F58517|nr:hypothetical protein [Streptomyces sp. N35]